MNSCLQHGISVEKQIAGDCTAFHPTKEGHVIKLELTRKMRTSALAELLVGNAPLRALFQACEVCCHLLLPSASRVHFLCRRLLTWTMRPTELNSMRTSSASSSLALPPRHIALAVSPTRQGVLGITRTSFASSPAASCAFSIPKHHRAWSQTPILFLARTTPYIFALSAASVPI